MANERNEVMQRGNARAIALDGGILQVPGFADMRRLSEMPMIYRVGSVDLSLAAQTVLEENVEFDMTVVAVVANVVAAPTTAVTLDVGDRGDAVQVVDGYSMDTAGVHEILEGSMGDPDLSQGDVLSISHNGENSANSDGEAFISAIVVPRNG